MTEKCIIYLTEKCNMACKHCYVKKSGREMTKEVADKLIEYLKNLPHRYENYVFMGGETLLSTDILLRFVHELTFEDTNSIAIMTNGTVSIRPFDEQLSEAERKKIYYNISVKEIGAVPPKGFLENIAYLKEHGLYFSLLAVNTPANIDKLEEFILYAKNIGSDAAIVLRQHMMGDFWTEEDVKKYAPVLKRLLHMVAYYQQAAPDFRISLPGKPFLTIEEGITSYQKYGINIVDQDSFCQYKIVGMDGTVYHCDGACGQKTHSYGYLWEEQEDPWIRELGYQDALYDYCELAKNKVFLPFDELNDACRLKHKSNIERIGLLKEEAND